MIRIKKISLLFVTIFLLSVFFLSISNTVLAQEFISIGTGSTGGTFYPCGVIFSVHFENHLKDEGYNFSAHASGGSGENLEMIRSGEIEMAVAGSVPTSDAYRGVGRYEGMPKLENVRFMTALWPEATQVVYRTNTEIEKLADFEGRKIAMGPPNGGGSIYMPPILKAVAGLTFDDIRVQWLGNADTAQAIQNRLIDAGYLGSGYPTTAVTEVYANMSRVPVDMIEFSDDELNAIKEVAPYFTRVILPQDTYPNQDRELNIIGTKSSLVVREDIDPDIVYKMLEVIYIKDLEEIKGEQAALRTLDLSDAIGGLSGAPLHAGAVKFYQDQGIEVPENMIPEEMK